MRQVCLSIDVEPDCPPYLSSTYRGVTDGIDLLLELFNTEKITATFFCTGDVARKYPRQIEKIVYAGHELASHGDMHLNYSLLNLNEAKADIENASKTLRQFAPVTSFRAPYLQFPTEYLKLLVDDGYILDSSQAKYKMAYYQKRKSYEQKPIKLVAASTTSSVLRLPKWLRYPAFALMQEPIILFVHPWEFIDLRKENLRLDCRFNTGPKALVQLGENIRYFKSKGFSFVPIKQM